MASDAWGQYTQQLSDSGPIRNWRGMKLKDQMRTFKLGESAPFTGINIGELSDAELWKMKQSLNPGNPGAVAGRMALPAAAQKQRKTFYDNLDQEYNTRRLDEWNRQIQEHDNPNFFAMPRRVAHDYPFFDPVQREWAPQNAPAFFINDQTVGQNAFRETDYDNWLSERYGQLEKILKLPPGARPDLMAEYNQSWSGYHRDLDQQGLLGYIYSDNPWQY